LKGREPVKMWSRNVREGTADEGNKEEKWLAQEHLMAFGHKTACVQKIRVKNCRKAQGITLGVRAHCIDEQVQKPPYKWLKRGTGALQLATELEKTYPNTSRAELGNGMIGQIIT